MINNEKIKIQDGSGDRNYFTIIPNYILNHSTATAQALYLQLKRLSGDKGVAYPSRKYLMDKLKISKPTLLKEFGYLLQRRWIKYIGEVEIKTPGGTQKVKGYKIIDIWKENNNFYGKGVKNNTPPTTKGVKNNTAKGVKQGGKKYTHKEEPQEEEPLQEELYVANATNALRKKKKYAKYDDPTPINLKEFIKWTESSPQRHVRIISQYADEKKPNWETKGQWYAFIDRNVRAARSLSPYSDKQIEEAFLKLKEAQGDYLGKWTLETLLKYLDPVD